jgi:hypothetical protein
MTAAVPHMPDAKAQGGLVVSASSRTIHTPLPGSTP